MSSPPWAYATSHTNLRPLIDIRCRFILHCFNARRQINCVQDSPGVKLPVNELPLFAFPSDLRLTYNSLNKFPLPNFFTFVFTDEEGNHLYAACLQFYEAVSFDDLVPVYESIYGAEHVSCCAAHGLLANIVCRS